MATPPPVTSRAKRSVAASLGSAFRRHAITLTAIALVVVAVTLLDRALATPGRNVLPPRVIAVAVLGAAIVSTLLRLREGRPETPSRLPQSEAEHRATDAQARSSQPAAARRHERAAVSAWRRRLLGMLAALGVVSLMLALVLRGPHSELLLGAGLSALLALRLLTAPPRGVPHVVAAGNTLPAVTTAPAARSIPDAPERGIGVSAVAPSAIAATAHSGIADAPNLQPASHDGAGVAELHIDAMGVPRPGGGEWRGWPADAIHDAALDSFPASDPPSWSPLRIGAPARANLGP
jgi:hypothetical protein